MTQIKLPISPFGIVKRLTIGAIVLTIISTAIQISKYVFDYRQEWMDTFNLDREMNLPTWYTALMLAFCALLLKVIATGKKIERTEDTTPSPSYHRHWHLLSIIFFLLAIDEVLTIHEVLIIPEVAEALRLPWFLHSMWVIPGTIFVLWFIRYYWKFTNHLPNQTRYHFLIAAGLYIGGALGMEMIGSYYAELEGQQHLTYALLATAEETMEMMGIITFIYGLLTYIRQWAKTLQVQVEILPD